MRRILPILLGLGVFLVDFFSKAWIALHLPISFIPRYPFGGIGCFRNFHGISFAIVHATNRGAAWGFFASYPRLLLLLRLMIIAILVGLLIFKRLPSRNWWPLALIIGGAVGNVVDFFLYGHVVDLFAFTFWGYVYPVFNVADSAIFCGIVLFLLQSTRRSYAKN